MSRIPSVQMRDMWLHALVSNLWIRDDDLREQILFPSIKSCTSSRLTQSLAWLDLFLDLVNVAFRKAHPSRITDRSPYDNPGKSDNIEGHMVNVTHPSVAQAYGRINSLDFNHKLITPWGSWLTWSWRKCWNDHLLRFITSNKDT